MTAPDGTEPAFEELLQKFAENYATSVAGGPLRDQAWHYVVRDIKLGAGWAMQQVAEEKERDQIVVLNERKRCLRAMDVLKRIASGYVTEGDCRTCDFDGAIYPKHHAKCEFKIAHEALAAIRSEKADD